MRFGTCVLVVILLCSAGVMGQQEKVDYGYYGPSNSMFFDYNAPGFGGRCRAMGGTCIALGPDAFATFANPATMVHVQKSLLSVDIVNTNDQLSALAEPRFNRDSAQFVSNYITLKRKHTKLTQAGAVAPFIYFGRDWWVGGGFHTAYDCGLKTEDAVYAGAPDWYTRSKSVDVLNLAVATKVHEYVALGLNLNYFARGYEVSSLTKHLFVDTLFLTGDFYFKDKSNFSGFGMDLGLLVEYEFVSLGLVVRPSHVVKQQALLLRSRLNYYGEPYGTYDRVTIKEKVPLSLSGGVAVRPVEAFTVAADVDWRPYSKTKRDIQFETELYVDFSDYSFNPQMEDMTEFRVGAEYVLMNGGRFQLPLRVGYRLRPTSYANFDEVRYDTATAEGGIVARSTSATRGEQITTGVVTLGGGIKFERLWFDVAYEYGTSDSPSRVVLQPTSQAWEKDSKLKISRLSCSFSMPF